MSFLQEYTMLDELGKGGFATVYKVRHNELGYIRAIRVLNDTVVDEGSTTYQRFLRECKILLRLGNGSHPNIVHIYQPRLLENKALVEMDYVDGDDIAKYLKKEGNHVAVAEVIRMATQISSALAYCHEDIYRFCMDRDNDNLQDDPNDGSKIQLDEVTRQRLISRYKVIHNDIHSGNIIRREDGNLILLDFGLAIDGKEVVRSSRRKNGAPEFKPPEKWEDDKILSEQSDIYSFGIVLYQYLAGRVPFPYNTSISDYKADAELANAHQNIAPPPIEMIRKEYFEKKHAGWKYTKDYPDWLENMILKCLAKDPDKRFKNGKELYNYIVEHSGDNEKFYESEIKRLNSVAGELNKCANDLNNQNTSLRTQLEDTRVALNGKNQELSNVQKSLQETNNDNKTLHSRLNNTKKMLWFTMFLLAIVMAISVFLYIGRDKTISVGGTPGVDVRSLEEDIEKKDKQLKAKDEEIAKLKRKTTPIVNNNTAEIKRLNETIADNKKQLDLLREKYKNEQEEAVRLRQQLSNMKKPSSDNRTNSSAEIAALQKQINQKEQEVSGLKKKLQSANGKISSLTKQLEDKKREVELLMKY